MHFLSHECPKFRTRIPVRTLFKPCNSFSLFDDSHQGLRGRPSPSARTSATDNETTVSTTIRPIPD